MGVTGPQQADEPAKMLLVNERNVFQLHGMGQQGQPGVVFAQRPFQEGHVEPLDVEGDIGQGVVGNQVEGDIGIAEGEVEIDEGRGMARILSEVAAEIDGDARGADAAAGTDNRDHERILSAAAAGHGTAVGLGAGRFKSVQGEEEFFENDRRGEEFLGPGPQRLQDRLAVAASGHREDRHSGKFAGQLLNELQGLVVIGVKRDDDKVGSRLASHVDEKLVA